MSASVETTRDPSQTGDRLVVVGQGYVGLPIAMRAVDAGFVVEALDTDAIRIGELRRGLSYIEDISSERVAAALSSGRFRPTSQHRSNDTFDYAVITVPTPLRESLPDLSFIEAAAATLAPSLRRGATVILESTTYPGTTDELLVPLLERSSGLAAGVDFYVGYSPERIDPGNTVWTFEATPKVVSGIDATSLTRVREFYDRLVNKTIPVSGTREAELTKLLENTFRHVNIALVNELAVYANQLGIDIWESIDAASTKPFGYLRFTPGPGVGGHCLPVDPSYLSWQVRRKLGRTFRFVELANDVNDHMPDYVIQRLSAYANTQHKPMMGAKILVIGLAYKQNTGDIRESPALRVLALLHDLGVDVYATDPHVETRRVPEYVTMVDLSRDSLTLMDMAIIVTDHDVFDYSVLNHSGLWTLDCRNRLMSGNFERL